MGVFNKKQFTVLFKGEMGLEQAPIPKYNNSGKLWENHRLRENVLFKRV